MLQSIMLAELFTEELLEESEQNEHMFLLQ